MAPSTKSHFTLFFTVFTISIVASHCEDISSPFGPSAQVTQTKEGQVQIWNVLYPPQSGIFKTTITQKETPSCSTKEEWYLITNSDSGVALHVTEEEMVVAAQVTGKDDQLWKFEQVGKPGFYYIVNKQSGKALQSGESIAYVESKSDLDRQRWLLDPQGRIYNSGSGKYLDLGTYPNSLLEVRDGRENHSQVFSLVQQTGNAGVHETEAPFVEESTSNHPSERSPFEDIVLESEGSAEGEDYQYGAYEYDR